MKVPNYAGDNFIMKSTVSLLRFSVNLELLLSHATHEES